MSIQKLITDAKSEFVKPGFFRRSSLGFLFLFIVVIPSVFAVPHYFFGDQFDPKIEVFALSVLVFISSIISIKFIPLYGEINKSKNQKVSLLFGVVACAYFGYEYWNDFQAPDIGTWIYFFPIKLAFFMFMLIFTILLANRFFRGV